MQRIHLDYFPRNSSRPRWVAQSALIIAGAILVAAAIRWLPPALHRAEIYSLQQKCLAHASPVDVPVNGVVPSCWTRFYAKLSPPGFNSGGTLLLHGMKTPTGSRRLVAIDLIPAQMSSLQYFEVVARVFEPGSPVRLPRESLRSSGAVSFPADALIDPAQLDPSDDSHFTVRYTLGGRQQCLDGWLTDDDAITLEFRPSSAAASKQVSSSAGSHLLQ